MDGANFNDPGFIFWVLAFFVFWLFVMLAIVYGLLRLVHAAWVEHLARSAANRSRPADRAMESHAPVRRRDALGRNRGRRASGSSSSGAEPDG